MVDWSRELLDPQARDLLQRLAVIPAPFTADAAHAVSGQDGPDARRGLATLVEQSLLTLDEGEDGPARYRMLETVREYGEARLDAAGDRADAMARLTRWAAAEAARLRADFVGHAQVAAFDTCATEQDTFLAGLRWAVAHDDEPSAVDVAAALLNLWTVRGLHVEGLGWAAQVLHADDPAARRSSGLLQGRAAGRPLPDGEQTAALCLFALTNAGALESTRIAALAWRGARRVLAERPHEVAPRTAALLTALSDVEWPQMDETKALPLVESDDMYLQAIGLFLRAAIRENGGNADQSPGDAREAYRRFESLGDHWGMGMAAQGIGQWDLAPEEDAALWLRRGVEHLELVGALQDARSARVLLDVRRALAGDSEALGVLQDVVATGADVTDVAQAQLGLAYLALREGRFDDAVAAADQTIALVSERDLPIPQIRTVFRVACAMVHLSIADRTARQDPARAAAARAQARTLLRLAAPDAEGASDMPVLGSLAIGVADLAALGGRAEEARELWASGTRLGANLARMFRLDVSEHLGAALGDDDARTAAVDALRPVPVATVVARLHALVAAVLGAA